MSRLEPLNHPRGLSLGSPKTCGAKPKRATEASVRNRPQPRRHMIPSQLMPAPGAELVRNSHRAEAVPAARIQLIGALRAEVKLILHMRSARHAARSHRQPQQEIKHRPNPARQHKADHHPETSAHGAPGSIPAHIAHHQEVESRQQAPRKIEINTQPKRRRRVMALCRCNNPPVIFDGQKKRCPRPRWTRRESAARLR